MTASATDTPTTEARQVVIETGGPGDGRPFRPDREPPQHDGDASTHLEDLLGGEHLPAFFGGVSSDLGRTADVELVGAHVRLSGTVVLGFFHRLSDYLNHHEGLIEIRDVTVLRRNGDPTKVTAESIWVNPDEVTIFGQNFDDRDPSRPADDYMAKIPTGLIVVTPGHTLTGDVYISPQAQLAVFIESQDPRYVPMTDVRMRSLADRRVISRYPFAMLNRRHIVAATALKAGMAPAGKKVL